MMSAMQKIKVECHRKEMSDASDLVVKEGLSKQARLD